MPILQIDPYIITFTDALYYFWALSASFSRSAAVSDSACPSQLSHSTPRQYTLPKRTFGFHLSYRRFARYCLDERRSMRGTICHCPSCKSLDCPPHPVRALVPFSSFKRFYPMVRLAWTRWWRWLWRLGRRRSLWGTLQHLWTSGNSGTRLWMIYTILRCASTWADTPPQTALTSPCGTTNHDPKNSNAGSRSWQPG